MDDYAIEELRRAADRSEITHLVATYAAEGDRGRVDKLLDIFAEDGVMVTPIWRAEGRAGIAQALNNITTDAARGDTRASLRTKEEPRRVSRHHITSCYITFDGSDEAGGRIYWINFSENGADHSGIYADKYRRINGHWRITAREVRLDWKSANSRTPVDLITGPRPDHLPPVPDYRG